MELFAPPFLCALAALETEWREIVREHSDLSKRPYDLERDGHHESRLRRYRAKWDHLIDALIADESQGDRASTSETGTGPPSVN